MWIKQYYDNCNSNYYLIGNNIKIAIIIIEMAKNDYHNNNNSNNNNNNNSNNKNDNNKGNDNSNNI